MSNYLKTIEFDDVETMHTVLLAAKLAIDPDVWKKARTDAFVDEDEMTIWTEADNYKPVERLWDFIFNDFDWAEADIREPDQSEIEISEYFEDCAITHNTTSRIDHLVELPSIEFEHNLYNGNLDRFVGEQAA
jgi:hypothetical protein